MFVLSGTRLAHLGLLYSGPWYVGTVWDQASTMPFVAWSHDMFVLSRTRLVLLGLGLWSLTYCRVKRKCCLKLENPCPQVLPLWLFLSFVFQRVLTSLWKRIEREGLRRGALGCLQCSLRKRWGKGRREEPGVCSRKGPSKALNHSHLQIIYHKYVSAQRSVESPGPGFLSPVLSITYIISHSFQLLVAVCGLGTRWQIDWSMRIVWRVVLPWIRVVQLICRNPEGFLPDHNSNYYYNILTVAMVLVLLFFLWTVKKQAL